MNYEWLQSLILPFININHDSAHLPVSISRDQSVFTTTTTAQQRYTAISSIGSHRKLITSVDRPSRIDITPQGEVFVCGQENGMIHQFGFDGDFVRRFGPLLDGRGPCSMSVYKNELFVANNGTSIHKYSVDTGLHAGLAYVASSPLSGITIDSDGLMYITQYGNGLIDVIDQNGNWVYTLTNISKHARKIQFDSDKNIRYLDGSSGSIHVITKGNHLIHEYFTNISSPDGFFIDVDDNMVISDSGSSVYFYDKGGRFIHEITGFKGCSDVQVSSVDDVLWITDVKDGKIYLF